MFLFQFQVQGQLAVQSFAAGARSSFRNLSCRLPFVVRIASDVHRMRNCGTIGRGFSHFANLHTAKSRFMEAAVGAADTFVFPRSPVWNHSSPRQFGTDSSSTGRLTGPRAQPVRSPSAEEGLRVLVLDDNEGLLAASPGIVAMGKLPGVASVRVLGSRDELFAMSDAERANTHVVMAVRERTRLDAKFFGRFPNLQLILQTGGHAYHVDMEAARASGVTVALGRRGFTAPTAAVPELTFALAISCLRKLPEAARAMPAGEWPALLGRNLGGKRMGLLGSGRHGGKVANIAKAFGMDVVAWDRPFIDRDSSARPGLQVADVEGPVAPHTGGIPRLPLRELLASSDVVSIHLRLSDDSRGLLDATKLAWMKPRSVLINTARGAIVDEQALISALADPSHPLEAAGLDVFETEPLPADSALRHLPNVALTPHIGWTVEEVFTQFAEIAARQLEAYVGEDGLNPEDVL